MPFNWEEKFGTEYFITVTNEERRYLGLNPISEDWEITRYSSKTNITYKRTTVFWSGDEVRKIICEEFRLPEGRECPTCRYIIEHDTALKTVNREILLPLTPRGKNKPVNASNILATTPFGSSFYFSFEDRNGHQTYFGIYNYRNCCSIAVGEEERVDAIRNESDFHNFMKYYMNTCPADYFERIDHLHTAKKQSVKYKNGDVFKIDIDRFNYCYGIITGQVLDICKWSEIPEFHSLRCLMTVPIMVRHYDIVTNRSDMTADELSKYPLSRMKICSDNDIFYGSYPIIDHKQLEEDDVEFNLVCTKIRKINKHATTHTFEKLGGLFGADANSPFNLYVEWGTANTILPYDRISENLKVFLKNYHDPHGGVSSGIGPNLRGKGELYRMNLLDEWNSEMREELFACLGLKRDADFDDFARAFNGLTKSEIIKKL